MLAGLREDEGSVTVGGDVASAWNTESLYRVVTVAQHGKEWAGCTILLSVVKFILFVCYRDEQQKDNGYHTLNKTSTEFTLTIRALLTSMYPLMRHQQS